MNPDDDDAVANQLQQSKLSIEVPSEFHTDYASAIENRKYQLNGRPSLQLQIYAEDELVKKEYKELRCEMPGTPRSTFLMVFSPDGTTVASTHGNHNIYITDTRNGKNLRTLIGHPRTPWCIAFHPTCNGILASGCLGGEVRIWDLSGSSEVWSAGSQTVIASIAFHPNNRILVIATYNELHFWDWSQPEPFQRIATNDTKEKIRYVAFDKLGHKLITGVANTPLSRWDRARSNAVQYRSDRTQNLPATRGPLSSCPYRRRITPRLVNYQRAPQTNPATNTNTRVPLSSVPERERRITACYRNLVHEYEQLVHRYLQAFRAIPTIDRGTDPMEPEYFGQVQTNNSSAVSSQDHSQPHNQTHQPLSLLSHSSGFHSPNDPPASSSILPRPLARADSVTNTSNIARFSYSYPPPPQSCSSSLSTFRESPSESSSPGTSVKPNFKIKCSPKRKSTNDSSTDTLCDDAPKCKTTNTSTTDVLCDDCMQKDVKGETTNENGSTRTSNVNNTSQDTTNSQEVPSTSVTSLNQMPPNRGSWRLPLKRLYPGFIKKVVKYNRKPILCTSSESSSSDDDVAKKRPNCASNNLPTNNNQQTDDTSSKPESAPLATQNILENIMSRRNDGNTDVERPSEGFNISPSGDDGLNVESVPLSASSRLDHETVFNSNPDNSNTTTNDVESPPDPSGGNSPTNILLPTLPPRRFFSPGLSYTLSPRAQIRSRRSNINISYVYPIRRSIESLRRRSSRLLTNLIPDEVINYSERVNSEEEPNEPALNMREFHPFDPPPEFPAINPENIGIGNMYSNIVQDLETSLTNVRNIRASNRPGETSDMLSSFSERLENIMHQSDTILRNLRQSMDMLPSGTETNEARRPPPQNSLFSQPILSPRNVEADPRFLFNDPSFYVRDHSQGNSTDQNRSDLLDLFPGTSHYDELDNSRNAVASDHTYPRNPESPRTLPPSTDHLTPLMASLHLTITHIQRQARLLRRQVDSIERIDRAMLEVAQLQAMRQMYGEIRRLMGNFNDSRSGSGLISVRQMMGSTRISEPASCNCPPNNNNQSSNNTEQNNLTSINVEESPSASSSSAGSSSTNSNNLQVPRQRVTRKTLPPSRLLHLQRQNRRFSVMNFMPRRYMHRDRLPRRRIYFRALPYLRDSIRSPTVSDEQVYTFSFVNADTLMYIFRRLEHLLSEHISQLPPFGELLPRDAVVNANDAGENAIADRLISCRIQLDTLLGNTAPSSQNTSERAEITSVTADGFSRFNARDTLSSVLHMFIRFLNDCYNSTISQSLRFQIRNIIDLTSLLSDVLLLRIVNSIPPPSGMNLDPERGNLANRIDDMCTRLMQRRFGQSQSLTRCLKLIRLTARYAARTLHHTSNIRRTATGTNTTASSSTNPEGSHASGPPNCDEPQASNTEPTRPSLLQLMRTLLLASEQEYMYLSTRANTPDTGQNNNQSRNSETPGGYRQLYRDTINNLNGDNSESDWFNNNNRSSQDHHSDHRQPLYRTSNVNLLNNEESAPTTSQNRAWNVPTVQINDVPILEATSHWHYSRITQHRYRLADLRASPVSSIFRPRFLHPHSAGVNPFDVDFEESQREHIYDGDTLITVTPNHRIQVWDFSTGNIPDISNSMKNIVVSECKIHNDASVDVSADGTILVTLLPSGGYLNVTNRLGVYSLRWETLGQCLFQTSFEQNAVSVSLSPLSRHLVVGLASRRVSIVPNDKWTMARIFLLNQTKMTYGSRLPVVRELEQNRDTNYMSLNCIRWLPISGQGLIYATNTGQLRILS